MQSAKAKFVGDVDFSTLHFGPFLNKDNKQSVEVWSDASSMTNKNKPRFNLCPFTEDPVDVRYNLDPIRYDANGNPTNKDRRGMKVKISGEAEKSLQVLDETIIKAAVEKSKEWFKKELTEDQVRLRYHPVVFRANEKDDFNSMAFKVKTDSASYPTSLNRMLPNGKLHENGGKVSDLEEGMGTRVVPILSAFSLWFMGGGTQFGISFSCDKMVIYPGHMRSSTDEFSHRTDIEVVHTADDDEKEGETGEEPATKKMRVEEEEEEEGGILAM